jgi:hypothetical protein
MMLVVGISVFVIMAVTVIQLVASRIYTTAATKVSATAAGRQALNIIRDQIRRSNTVQVGTCDGTTFTQAPTGSAQTGNALAISYLLSATTNIYYLDQSMATTNILYGFILGSTTKTMLARYVTNYYCFTAENFQGNVLNNYQNSPVIHVVLQFSKWEYPIGVVGGTNQNAYDFYTLQTRIARRSKQ